MTDKSTSSSGRTFSSDTVQPKVLKPQGSGGAAPPQSAVPEMAPSAGPNYSELVQRLIDYLKSL